MNKTFSGYSLVQLLIALSLGLLVISGVLSVFISSSKFGGDTLRIHRLNYELEMIMEMMSSEIRRAGYWAQATNDVGTGVNTNPFMTGGMNISVNAANDCILFGFDLDSDGALPALGTMPSDERFGFRLNSQSIQSRPSGAPFDCSAVSDSWENLNNANDIVITGLSMMRNDSVIDLDDAGPGTESITIREIVITLSGQLAADPTVSKTIVQTVRVRNDYFSG